MGLQFLLWLLCVLGGRKALDRSPSASLQPVSVVPGAPSSSSIPGSGAALPCWAGSEVLPLLLCTAADTLLSFGKLKWFSSPPAAPECLPLWG